MDRLKIIPRELLYAYKLHEWYSRRLGFRTARLCGFESPVRESNIHSDEPQLSCPFAIIVRKYMPCVGKLVSLPVPCGKCTWCKHHSQNALIFRLYNHAKCYKNMLFVTLTYNDEHYTEDVSSLRYDITTFIKRFRKELDDKTFSYYMVCERGDERNRCHFHMILFWNGPASKDDVINLVSLKWRSRIRNYMGSDTFDLDPNKLFTSFSSNGFIYVDKMDCEDTAVMSYVSKYVSESQKKLIFRSWSIGLGRAILETDSDLLQKMLHHRVIQYMPKDKLYTIAVPSYYKNAIFTQGEKDIMFNDYLCSDDITNFMDTIKNPVKREQIFYAFVAYEKRCLQRYNARKEQKRKRKRLL